MSNWTLCKASFYKKSSLLIKKILRLDMLKAQLASLKLLNLRIVLNHFIRSGNRLFLH